MVIANPIYDVVFKYLMEDERTAKFFIGTLLEEEIESIVVKPQEFAYFKDLDLNDPEVEKYIKERVHERLSINIFRLDFIATIKTQSGEFKKVLVEIQKAKNLIDLMRFRNYLGEQYKKEDEIAGQRISLPIVTIYLLGFNLNEIETPVLKVNRQYIDLLSHKIIDKKSDFIEKLTHDSFVVQLCRIQGKVYTKLEKLLSIFEQKYFVDDNTIKEYNYLIDDEDIKRMIDNLHYVGTEPKEKKKIENEQEAWRTFDALTGGIKDKAEKLHKELEVRTNQLAESKKEIEQSKKEVEENAKQLAESKKEIEESKKEIEESKKEIEELKRRLREK